MTLFIICVSYASVFREIICFSQTLSLSSLDRMMHFVVLNATRFSYFNATRQQNDISAKLSACAIYVALSVIPDIYFNARGKTHTDIRAAHKNCNARCEKRFVRSFINRFIQSSDADSYLPYRAFLQIDFAEFALFDKSLALVCVLITCIYLSH